MKFLNLSLKKEIKAKELSGMPPKKREFVISELKHPTIPLPTEIVDEEVRITDVENLNIDSEQFETIPHNTIDYNNEIDSEEIHDNTSYEDKNEVADNTSANNNYDPNAGDVDEMDIRSFFNNFANEYNPQTGKFKEDGHFPNGIEDIYKYLNDNPDLAMQVLGAIANESGGRLPLDFIETFYSADDREIRAFIDCLSSYGPKNEDGTPQSNNLAENLEYILASVLENEGYSDLAKDLFSNGNYNNDVFLEVVQFLGYRKYENDGNNGVNVNGDISDENTNQQSTGDCWYLASLISAMNNDEVNEAIKSLVTVEDGIYTVILDGKKYSYTLQQLGIADELSKGDADVRAFEMAMRTRMWSEGLRFQSNDLFTFAAAFAGNYGDNDSAYTSIHPGDDITKILEQIKSGNYLAQCGLESGENGKNDDIINSIKVYDENGNEIDFKGNHAYSVVNADDEFVYLRNPHNKDQLLKISIEDFKKLNCQTVNANTFKQWVEWSKEDAEQQQIDEKMEYYNQLLAAYGDKELTQEDIDAIIAALKEKGIDYYKDILGKDNENSVNGENNYSSSATDSSGVETVTTTDKNGNKTETQYEIINGKKVPTQIVITGKDGSVSKTEQFEYNANGNMTRESVIEYKSDGSIMTNLQKSYTYDEQGNMIRGYSQYSYGNQPPSTYSQTKVDGEGNQITVTYSFSTHEEISRTLVDKEGNKTVLNADGSSRVTEYQTVDGNKVKKSDITYDKNGEVVSDYEYNNDGTLNNVTNYSTDEAGNKYKYYLDCATGKRELVQVTNKKGETFVIKNYLNSEGGLDWDKLREDGWGISLSGELAKYAFADLQNGATIEEIIIKYRYAKSNGGNSGVSWEPWKTGEGGYLPDGTYSPIATNEWGSVMNSVLGVGMHEGGQGGSLVRDSFSSFGSGGASSGGTQLVPGKFYFH